MRLEPRTRSLVTGAPRSGTTWIGAALAAHERVGLVHEPLNTDHGVAPGVDWFPSILNPSEVRQARQIYENVLSGRARYMARAGDGWLKARLRTALGGREDRAYRRMVRSRPDHLVVKDPFALLCAPALLETFDMRAVVMVRHPCAFALSMKRMNWTPPLETVAAKLSARLPQAWPDDPERAHSARCGRFWGLLYASAAETARAHSQRVLLVRHEDACLDPLAAGRLVCDHLDIRGADPVLNALAASTRGALVTPKPGELHAMTRDAAALAWSWKQRLDPEEADDIMRHAGSALADFYPAGADQSEVESWR